MELQGAPKHERIGHTYKPIRYLSKRRQPLTCIIGAICAEGLVIVADTRIMRDLEATNESKFRFLWDDHVIVAGSGTTALLDYFTEGIAERNKGKLQPSSWFEATREIEDTLGDVKSRYLSRFGRDYELDIMFAGLEGVEKGDVSLRVGDARAISEKVEKSIVIGSGSPYVRPFFQLMFSQLLTLKETAILGWFSMLSVIRMGIDQSIGVAELGPEIVVLEPNQKPRYLSPYADSDFELATRSAFSLDFGNRLVRKIWKKIPQAYETLDTS